jgi:MoaA/NifB/PqqE/SkfB family radical SAM enzyme
VIQRNPTHPGAKRLRPFAESRSGPTRSELEDRFVAFCGRYGLPTPATSVELLGYEVDALPAVEKVIVELDSWEFHGLRPNFEGDRNRDADMLAAGYQTVRITDERMTQDPEGEARRLHAILDARRKAA